MCQGFWLQGASPHLFTGSQNCKRVAKSYILLVYTIFYMIVNSWAEVELKHADLMCCYGWSGELGRCWAVWLCHKDELKFPKTAQEAEQGQEKYEAEVLLQLLKGPGWQIGCILWAMCVFLCLCQCNILPADWLTCRHLPWQIHPSCFSQLKQCKYSLSRCTYCTSAGKTHANKISKNHA